MHARGLGRDEQRVGDLTIGPSLGEQRDDVELTRGEPEPVGRGERGRACEPRSRRARRARLASASRTTTQPIPCASVYAARRLVSAAARSSARRKASAARQRAYASRGRIRYPAHRSAIASQSSPRSWPSARATSAAIWSCSVGNAAGCPPIQSTTGQPLVESAAELAHLREQADAGVGVAGPLRGGGTGGQTVDDDVVAHAGGQGRIVGSATARGRDRALERAGLVAAPRRDRDEGVLDDLAGFLAERRRGTEQPLDPVRLDARPIELAVPDREEAAFLGDTPGVDADRREAFDLADLFLGFVPAPELAQRFARVEAQEEAERAVEPVCARRLRAR